MIDYEKLIKDKEELQQIIANVVPELQELNDEYERAMDDLKNRYSDTLKKITDSAENGYMKEVFEDNKLAIGAITNGNLKNLHNLYTYAINKHQVGSRTNTDLQRLVEKFSDLSISKCDIELDTNIPNLDIDDFIKKLKANRPKTAIDRKGNKIAKRGKFTLHCRYITSDGKTVSEQTIGTGYCLRQSKLNKFLTDIHINEHYALQIGFGVSWSSWSADWVTMYINPNEVVREMYNMSKQL